MASEFKNLNYILNLWAIISNHCIDIAGVVNYSNLYLNTKNLTN